MTPDNENDFASMLAEFEPSARSKTPKRGEMVSGTIINIGAQSVFVDLGAKSEGVLGLEEVTNDKGEIQVAVGDTIEARVVEVDGKAGCIVLRRSVAKGADALEALGGAFEHGIPVEGMVTALNKGGFDVTVAGHRAFCPISQIDNRFVEDGNAFVGHKYHFRITRLEPGRGRNMNIVVSRRQLLDEEKAKEAAALRETLKEGAVVTGTVSTLKDYGAFVDLGGLEGMLHISEMGHGRISHPSEMLSEGQQIEVQILKIEPATGKGKDERISLSIKAMHDSPWEKQATGFKVGQRVKGRIVRLQQFGAFVELAPGVEGLVHISELGAGRRVNHPRDVVSEGQEVEVSILAVDLVKQRIGLSMKDPDQIRNPEAERSALAEHNAKSAKSLGTFADLLKGKL